MCAIYGRMETMAIFTAQIRPYGLDAFGSFDEGLGWSLDPRRCALLVHDVLPYYLKVLHSAQGEALVSRIEAMAAAAWLLMCRFSRRLRDLPAICNSVGWVAACGD